MKKDQKLMAELLQDGNIIPIAKVGTLRLRGYHNPIDWSWRAELISCFSPQLLHTTSFQLYARITPTGSQLTFMSINLQNFRRWGIIGSESENKGHCNISPAVDLRCM